MDSAREKAVLGKVPQGLFIGGQWRDSRSGKSFGVEDPATEQTLTQVADGTPEDATAALDACVAAQSDWAATPPRERGEILRRTFELMNTHADDLALLMTMEMGKPLAESRAVSAISPGRCAARF